LQIISAHDILSRHGLAVVQHFKKDILPDALGVLHLFRQSRYGDTLLSLYRKEDKFEARNPKSETNSKS
jgi:16S rRNA G966 N2-methylase RsmD